MPRTAKKGFTYYGFDTDHFYDPKVKRLKINSAWRAGPCSISS